MPISVRCVLACASPTSRMADVYKHVVGVSYFNSQHSKCGFLGMVKAFKKSICPHTVNLAGKALSVWEWKPNACSKSVSVHTICG